MKLTLGAIGTAIGITATILTGIGWGTAKNDQIKRIPIIEAQQKEHEKDDDADRAAFKDAINEIKTDIKVINVKMDYGKTYDKPTRDTIFVIKHSKK